MFVLIKYLLIVTLAISATTVDACLSSPGVSLGVITEDAEIQEGTSFAITCDLKKMTIDNGGETVAINSSNIFFEHKSSVIASRVIDGSSAQIKLTSSHVNDSGPYFCYVQVGESHPQLVCSMELTVGQPPRELEGIKCVSEHYENLTCVWNPPNYNTATTYEMSEVMTNALCPHRLNQTACMWTLSSQPHYRQSAEWIRVSLKSSNKYGNHTQLFDVNNFAIIRPPPPERLQVINVTPSTVELIWENEPTLDLGPADERSPHPIIEFQIFQRDIHGLVKNVTLGPVKSYIATDLIPDTGYQFSVRSKTIQSKGDDYWSRFSNVTTATDPDVPYRYPIFLNESLESVLTGNGKRSITLFWTPVDKIYSNSRKKNFHYIITYSTTHVSRRARDVVTERSKELNPEETSWTFNDLSPTSAYNFRVRSKNDLGPSEGFSEVTVDKHDKLPPKPTNFETFYYGDGRYELRWNKSSSTNHYMVSWCPNARPGVDKCTGPMDTERVGPEALHSRSMGYFVNLTDNINYHFAVSAVSHSASSLTWSTCVVPVALRKLDKLHKISLTSININSLQLQWKLPCPGLHSVVSRFEIIYCRVTRKNGPCIEEKRINLNNSRAEDYTLSGLQPASSYRVSIKMWNDSSAGEESDPIEASTVTETDLTYPILFGLLLLIITLLSLICLRRLFRGVKRELDDMKQPVQLPGKLGDSSNLTESILGQSHSRLGNRLTAADELRKHSGGSVGSHSSSDGLINSKHKARLDFQGTEMKVMRSGDTTDLAVRESCPDDNSNTNRSNSGAQVVKPSVQYLTHERLSEMGRGCQFNGTAMVDRSHTNIEQSDVCDGMNQFGPPSVRRVSKGYVQVTSGEIGSMSPPRFVPKDSVAV